MVGNATTTLAPCSAPNEFIVCPFIPPAQRSRRCRLHTRSPKSSSDIARKATLLPLYLYLSFILSDSAHLSIAITSLSQPSQATINSHTVAFRPTWLVTIPSSRSPNGDELKMTRTSTRRLLRLYSFGSDVELLWFQMGRRRSALRIVTSVSKQVFVSILDERGLSFCKEFDCILMDLHMPVGA